MYESHFGFTAAPFSLNPDPAFFFESRGHGNALSYLKFGVYQGEGFVVVTGEIGAGKTTLVRTLLSDLAQKNIVAAQIVSTQLEAGDLLRSVALAFGIATKNLSKAELIATIEAFLTLLVTENKRALLIVDEAQNLDREAVEELRMLSNFQLGNQALLQSFLVGQPELRELLTSKPMEQFRQRVIASCHLGPMDSHETRAYIEHRLQQVGWTGRPGFEDSAFDRVFHWTSGIPRRVNLLCNRLLLSAYLAESERIDGASVDTIGEEVRREVGEASVATAGPALRPADASAVFAPWGTEATGRTAVPNLRSGPASLVCVASNASDDTKVAALLHALRRHSAQIGTVHVRIGETETFLSNKRFFSHLGLDVPALELNVSAAVATEQMAQVLTRLPALLEDLRPAAVLVFGASDMALACSLAARKMGCALIHINAGERQCSDGHGDELNNLLIDRLANLFYPAHISAYINLLKEGVSEQDVLSTADLLADAVQLAGSFSSEKAAAVEPRIASLLSSARGFGLVMVDDALLRADRDRTVEVISMLHEIARDTPLQWPMTTRVDAHLRALGLKQSIHHERIVVLDSVDFLDSVALMKRASLVVSDSPQTRLQAAVLRVRCLSVDARGAAAGRLVVPESGAAQSIADHLTAWLSARCETRL